MGEKPEGRTLFDIVNRFRWCNPTLRVDVINGCLYALSVVFRKQPQMFAPYFNFCPNALNQHWGVQICR